MNFFVHPFWLFLPLSYFIDKVLKVSYYFWAMWAYVGSYCWNRWWHQFTRWGSCAIYIHRSIGWRKQISLQQVLTSLDIFFLSLSLCLTVFITLLIFYLGDRNLRLLLNLNKTKDALQHCLLILKRTDSQLHNILSWLLMWLEIFILMSLKDNYICMGHHTQLHGNHFWILKMMSFSVSWKKRKRMPFLRAI